MMMAKVSTFLTALMFPACRLLVSAGCLAIPSLGYAGAPVAPPCAGVPAGEPSSQIQSGEECTIAVITGAVTVDGRPLLWKNRDSSDKYNEVIYFDDGEYPYITLTTVADTSNARLGVNEAGFAVVNALSHNLPDTLTEGITNGEMMKEALRSCASVGEFELLLSQTCFHGLKEPANIGVIDALGGAAIFEAHNYAFVKFDGEDPGAAPDGFLVRANFSFSGDTTHVNTWRYGHAYEWIAGAAAEDRLDVAALLQVGRDLVTRWVDPYPLPYEGGQPADTNAIGFVDASDTINRFSTVAFGVIRGVMPGEDPRLSTFYASPGHPVVTIVLPVWVAAGQTPEALDGLLGSPLCNLACARADDCYNALHRPTWLNTFFLVHRDDGEGFLVRVNQIEEWLLGETETYLQAWYAHGVEDAVLTAVEQELAQLAFDQYQVPISPPSGFDPGESPVLTDLTCWPNPTGEGTAISYCAPSERAAPYGIEIWDVSGRLLRSLRIPGLRERSPVLDLSGNRNVIAYWDGRDDNGRPVASGVYYIRPATGRAGGARRIVVIRG